MRKILFRGKRVDNKEWIYGDLRQYIDLPVLSTQRCPDFYEIDTISTTKDELGLSFKIETKTIGQFTGLTDKNGNRIFEGDIVQGEAEEACGVVEWQNAECRYLVSVRNGYDWLCMDDDKWEVIGNIHDNPKLLENK